ncbi:MAG: LLM class F420-dependent oxidoreductase [Anaerolineales bacterium]
MATPLPQIALMVEGQNGLNWQRWMNLARAAEDLGFVGLYRSDHFTNANPPDKDSLELWVSLTWLATHTQRLEFGPLVSPVSFRHPALTARTAAAVDDLSGGRLTLGVGAGWQVREHTNFGFDLLELPERFTRFEEALHVLRALLHSEHPVEFQGAYYRLKDALLLPRPQRPGGPPLLIGGNGEKRTLPLVAHFADEWNAVYIPADEFNRLNTHLNHLLHANHRNPASVRRSLMTGLVFAENQADLNAQIRARGSHLTAEDLKKRGLIVGTPKDLPEQLATLAAAGVQRVMLQWLNLEDLSGLQALARAVF